MKNYYFIILILLNIRVSAQFITISDPNFAQAICLDYPSAMDPTCSNLDTTESKKIDITLDVSFSNIVNADEINHFQRIDTLILSNNEITELPASIEPAEFWSLTYLDISNNKITNFPRLSINIDYLLIKSIYFQNNQASSFQKLWGARDSLINLDISYNFIKDCEDYSMALLAESIDLSNNYFTFEDLLPQTNHPNYNSVFSVFPQKTIPWESTETVGTEQSSFTLQLPFDDDISNSTYDWYKNGALLETTTSNRLTFNNLNLDDAGEYSVIIRNSSPYFTGFQIETETIELQVESCMDFVSNSLYSVIEKCNGASVTAIPEPSLNGTSPFTYVFKSNDDSLIYSNQEKLDLPINTYKVSVIDSLGCTKVIEEELDIYSFKNCDENVISPNGDGLQDEYYFDYVGEAIIYNQNGQEIKKLNLPNFWNGKTDNGSLVSPGKYMMILDDSQKIEVKVVW